MVEELVARHRAAILSDWFERIVGAYPDQTARFLRQTGDPFGNPVGAALREELGTVLDGVFLAVDDERLLASLDRIIRVRAVQDFSPSAAVGFVLELKPILRQLAADAEVPLPTGEVEQIDALVDRLVLKAFEVYSACREQIFEIRVRSIRDLSAKQIEKLNDWRAGRKQTDDAVEEDTIQEEGRRTEWAP